MGILTREQILEAQDIGIETVAVPEWGGDVLVRHLSAAQLERVQVRIQSKAGIKGVTAALACLAIVDESGKRLFRENDIEALGQKSMAALNRVMEAIKRMNAITDDDMEELAKNFEDGQGDGSPSD